MRLKGFAFCFAILLITLLTGSRTASAQNGQDRVSFGSRIVVGEDESVDDVVCFLCSVEIRGKVHGDVVTFLGSVKSSSPIQGDVVSFAGNVVLDEDASVGGDLVIFGGSLRKSADTRIAQDQVIFPAIIFFVPILILAAIIWGIAVLVRRRPPVYYVPPAR